MLLTIPYINTLTLNTNNRFASKEVSILVAMSVFNPAQLPDSSQDSFNSYGNEEMKLLATFYGEEVEVELLDSFFKSPKVLDGDGLISDWPVFQRALLKEKQVFMSAKSVVKIPTFQELFEEIHSSEAYLVIFPETFTLMNIMMTLPVGTATVERSFSYLKMITDCQMNTYVDRLLRNVIEGPELENDFEQVLDFFKPTNCRIRL